MTQRMEKRNAICVVLLMCLLVSVFFAPVRAWVSIQLSLDPYRDTIYEGEEAILLLNINPTDISLDSLRFKLRFDRKLFDLLRVEAPENPRLEATEDGAWLSFDHVDLNSNRSRLADFYFKGKAYGYTDVVLEEVQAEVEGSELGVTPLLVSGLAYREGAKPEGLATANYPPGYIGQAAYEEETRQITVPERPSFFQSRLFWISLVVLAACVGLIALWNPSKKKRDSVKGTRMVPSRKASVKNVSQSRKKR